MQKALALVSEKQPAWTRHDLVKQLALVMPAESRRMSAQAARELLLGLAEEALSGRGGDVVCLEAPEWPPLPASLRRELDGRSVYTRPGVARYATAAQLSAEERLVAHAQARRAPRLPGELAARRLGVDAELVAAQLRERAQDAHQQATRSGLRLDQAAAVWHVLTSARTVEVVDRPGRDRQDPRAGRRARGRGAARCSAPRPRRTPPTSSATPVSASRRTRPGSWPTCDAIPPGSLIEVDEGSMVSLAHLAALVEHAARNGCKLVLAGDQEQLAAVEGGGAMMLLAGPARLRAAGRAGPVHRRLGTRGLAAAAPRGRHRAGRLRPARPDPRRPARAGHGPGRPCLRGQLPGRAGRPADGRGLGPVPGTVRPDPRRPDPPRPGRRHPGRAHRGRR